MVAGSNLSWQGIKRKAVYTEGAGPVCKCTGQCTLPRTFWEQVQNFPHMGKFMQLIQIVLLHFYHCFKEIAHAIHLLTDAAV